MTVANLSTAELAELAALRGVRRAPPFADFVARVSPMYAVVPKHLRKLYTLIERSRYEQVFARISMPPRHGKTTSLALGFAYRTLYDPRCQNFYTTYADNRSGDVGLATMRLVDQLGVPLDPKKRGASDWGTAYGGGLLSTSVGGQITGAGANGGLVVCDDLLKGSKAARSKATRHETNEYLRTDVMSRVEGGASVFVVNTRWHDEDPVGFCEKELGAYPWEYINEPAIHDDDGNPIDERLFPELATPLWLDVDDTQRGSVEAALRWYALARSRGESQWWALYQGTPRSESGKIFQVDPTRYTLPRSRLAEGLAQPFDWRNKRGCVVLDPAATESTKADFSAIGVIAMEGNGDLARAYAVDMHKEQIKVPAASRMALRWKRSYRLPLVVEGVGGFKSVPQIIEEIVPGIDLEIAPMFGDKVTRAQLAADMWNDGRLLLPAGVDENGKPLAYCDWIEDTIRVCRAFTGNDSDEDDVVDVIAHGVNFLRGKVSAADKWRGFARAIGAVR